MNRILTCTTALAVALAGINPAALSAQTRVQVLGQTVVCLPNKKTACPDGEKCVVAKNPDNCQKRAMEKFGGGNPERQSDSAQQQPGKKAAAEENTAPARKKAADEPVKKQKKQAEDQKPAKQKKAEKKDKAEKKEKNQVKAAEEPQVRIPGGAPGSQGDNAGQAFVPDSQATVTATPEQKPRKLRKPRVEEDKAIADVLGGEPAVKQAETTQTQTTQADGRKKRRISKKPAKPEAALIPDGAPRSGDDAPEISQTRISREDRRNPDRDYETPVIGDQQTAKKDSGGLSKLEKAGLLALGALAVGTLLKNGNRVVSNTGDRVIVDRGYGDYVVLKDDDALLREPGSDVRTETYRDGSTRTTVYRADGSQIVTIRDASGRVLRRARINPDGSQTLLIDDLSDRVQEVDLSSLPAPVPGGLAISTAGEDAALRARMLGLRAAEAGRSFSLAQIRDYPEVRALAPTVDVDNITFDTGSAAIRPSEAEKLSQLGSFMARMIDENPGEMFLIEGHTDAVGDAAYNLALSDRRAESVALALTEYFGVPAENMVVQGYGESELRIASGGDEPRNRRAAVRMISPLMRQLAAN